MVDFIEDYRQSVAAVFRRKAVSIMSPREFKFCVSMDMNWFPPAQAGQLMENAVKAGVLKESERGIEPVFNVADVVLRPDFKPSSDLLNYKVEALPLFIRIVNAIVRETGRKKNEVVVAITRKKEALDIETDIAALMHARELGVDIRPFLKESGASLEKPAK